MQASSHRAPDGPRDWTVDDPGGLALEFHGTCLADGREHDIGHVRIWRTDGGRYLLRQRYSTRPGIIRIDRAEVGAALEPLLATPVRGKGLTALRRVLGLLAGQRVD
ncbi:MAG: hypothetical protein ACOY45_09715 [Pseudomonadota bacterium]